MNLQVLHHTCKGPTTEYDNQHLPTLLMKTRKVLHLPFKAPETLYQTCKMLRNPIENLE